MSAERHQEVVLALTAEEALVLFDWLGRTSEAGQPVPFADPAEQVVLWNVECMLESVLVAPFRPDYESWLDRARDAVRGDI